ncbi:hypothetical protein JCM6882_006703 [Rhodosporidiobolus microsporus]
MDNNDTRRISAELLRIAGTVLLQLDVVEGLKASAARFVSDELQELVEKKSLPTVRLSSPYRYSSQAHPFLRQAARDSLTSAIAALASTAPSVPYDTCLTAQSHLLAALQSLATPPTSSPSSSLSCLPTELLAEIISRLQEECDAPLRQRTNAYLARTSRALKKLVQPVLDAEAVIRTPRQLEHLAAKVSRHNITVLRSLEHVDVDVELDEIKRQKDDSWAGRRLLPVLGSLIDFGVLESLSVRLRSSTPCSVGHHQRYRTTYQDDVETALGLFEGEWAEFQLGSICSDSTALIRLELPNLSRENAAGLEPAWEVFMPPPTLRQLRLGCLSPPAVLSPNDFRRAREAYTKRQEENNDGDGFAYEVLALPYHSCIPSDFLPLVLPLSPSTTPTVYHLEAAFFIEALQQDLASVAEILTILSSVLRHLVLRIECPDAEYDNVDLFVQTVVPALKTCSRLEHLEIGGQLVDTRTVVAAKSLPALEHLVLLSTCKGADMFDLSHTVPSQLLSYTLVLQQSWDESDLRFLAEECQQSDVKLIIQERPEEYAWLVAVKDWL